MGQSDLEDRVAKLETEFNSLRKLLGEQPSPTKDWRAIIGTFADDPIFEEAMKLGREYRESLRPKARPKRKARS